MPDEAAEILAAVGALSARGERAVLATLVGVSGSSVRRPGARLLLGPGGRMAGFLGAGCLEEDLAGHARQVLADGRAHLVAYAPDAVEDPVLGLGLGCRGALDVLLEPVPGPALALVEATVEGARRRADTALALLLPPGGAGAVGHLAVHPGEPARTDIADPGLAAAVEARARSALARPEAGMRRVSLPGPARELVIGVVPPPVAVVVVGGGPHAAALRRLAMELGWRTAEGGPLLERPDRWTAVVLLGHRDEEDAALLESLLGSRAFYIGVLGSRRRHEALLRRLRERGALPPGRFPDALHAPVGLDLGAETAEELALAVTAEILARRRGRSGGRLRDGAGSIHDRAAAV